MAQELKKGPIDGARKERIKTCIGRMTGGVGRAYDALERKLAVWARRTFCLLLQGTSCALKGEGNVCNILPEGGGKTVAKFSPLDFAQSLMFARRVCSFLGVVATRTDKEIHIDQAQGPASMYHCKHMSIIANPARQSAIQRLLGYLHMVKNSCYVHISGSGCTALRPSRC